MSTSASSVFKEAGKQPGIEIWRIENFDPVPVPASDHGKFFSGDSYIVLKVTDNNGGAYKYDLHFWLGKDTSQDEAGTAAIVSVELDDALGGRAIQHREVQGHESDAFLSYFKAGLRPMEGGFASGFRKHVEEKFENRLYICSGANKTVKMQPVPLSSESLNHGDVFILDTADKIFQFNGAKSSIHERGLAFEVVQSLKEKYHEGSCQVSVVRDGDETSEFWDFFGGFSEIEEKAISEVRGPAEKAGAQLYSVEDGEEKLVSGKLSRRLLENYSSCLVDCGDELFVWVCEGAKYEEKKEALQVALKFLAVNNRPKSVRVTTVIPGLEQPSFVSCFE